MAHSTDCDDNLLSKTIGVSKIRHIKKNGHNSSGTVPDVLGCDAPTAVKILEEKGYNVKVNGVGHVATQMPVGGSALPAGTTITLSLKI